MGDGRVKKILLGAISGAVIAGAVLFFVFTQGDQQEETKTEGERTVSADMELMNEQNSTERVMRTTYKQRDYDMRNPLVIPDPYGAAPLTALVKFETEKPLEITVTVKGNTVNTDIVKTFDGYQTSHAVPVLGLYPDQENIVEIKGKSKDGSVIKKELSIKTEPLPDDFLTTEFIESSPKKMENGLTFLIPSSKSPFAMDSNGDIRWYSSFPNSHVFSVWKTVNYCI